MSSLDIVIPVYNEGGNIISVLDALQHSVHVPFRILICYDHDDDNTLEALRTYEHPSTQAPAPRPGSGQAAAGGLCSPRAKISLVKNLGHGVHGAVISGFRASTAPAVLVFAADDTYNAGIIPEMFRKFQQGCEIVSASRFMVGGRMEGCPWLKAVLVRLAALTLYHFAHVQTHDASNGFRLFSRRVLDQIEIESSQGFTYSIELLVKCHRLGWKIGEVPALWFERTRGTSRFRVLKWLPAYLRWYFYAFATTYIHRKPVLSSHR